MGDLVKGTGPTVKQLTVPYDMKHLPIQDYVLLQHFVEAFVLDPKARDNGMFSGRAVFEGFPCDPSKPTSCAYVVRKLPTPDLGQLPREEIMHELRADVVAERKQRRDVDFPCQEKESQSIFEFVCQFWKALSL